MTDWAALIERAKTPEPRRSGPRPAPREHGTERGYQQHRRNPGPACGRCCYAHQLHNQQRTATVDNPVSGAVAPDTQDMAASA